MSRRFGPVLVVAASLLAACTYTFGVPDTAQIACTDGGAPCPTGWDCEPTAGRCVPHGSVLEIPEVRVRPGTALATSESGGASSLAVTLGATPTAPVRIPVISTRTAEARIASLAELTFTASNWNQPQTITVQGVRDDVKDGDQAYEVVVGPFASDDARYSGLVEIRIPGTNADVDTAEVRVNPAAVSTSEAPGTPAVPVQVSLSSKPTAAVTIPIASSDPAEAVVTPTSITIQPANWNVLANIQVSGVDDPAPVADGRRPYNIVLGPATSTDPNFQGVTATIPGTNEDNDSPGVHLDRTAGLTTREGGWSDSFSAVLFTQPSADVTVSFTSLNPAEVTVSPDSVTFDAGNWNVQQWVTVTGVDDFYDEPDQTPWTVQTSNAVSTDPNYSGQAVADVTGTNDDDDSPGITLNPWGVSGKESDLPTQVTVTLQSQPRGPITIRPLSQDTAKARVSPSSIVLDNSTWQTGATMTVTPVDNQVRAGDTYVYVDFAPLTAGAQDPGYQNLQPGSMYVGLSDDERIIFTLSSTNNGDLTDGGTVYLDSLCQQQDPGGGGGELLSYPKALVAYSTDLWNRRTASEAPNAGDNQSDWVLTAGMNYLSETRNGPVIARANAQALFDFPLARPLSTVGDYWTGLNPNWTTGTHCLSWTQYVAVETGGVGGAGATNPDAIAKGVNSCTVPLRLLCVEQ